MGSYGYSQVNSQTGRCLLFMETRHPPSGTLCHPRSLFPLRVRSPDRRQLLYRLSGAGRCTGVQATRLERQQSADAVRMGRSWRGRKCHPETC